MNVRPENPSVVQIRPPQLIQSLTSGFNAVASNIYLILLPAALDLLLWFGPHLRLKQLVEPALLDLIGLMRQTSSLEMRPMLDGMENLWKVFLNQYNLFSVLSTFPIGIPALMAAQSPMQTPFGAAPIVEVTTSTQAALAWVGLSLIGLGIGTFYFAWVAQGCARVQDKIECPETSGEGSENGKIPPLRLSILAWQGFQTAALMIILMLIAMILTIPSIFMASFLALISPFLAQAVLLLILFSAVWFLVPLIFSPHGIFLCGQSVLNAMVTSTRVVRFSLPGTGLFLMMMIILYQGLGLLWRIPPDSSWMALVGILGHAFIATGLLAASFFYYRGGLAYVQSLRKISLMKRGV